MATYNSFYHMVKDDRASEHAMDMEREVLNHCMAFNRRGTNGVDITTPHPFPNPNRPLMQFPLPLYQEMIPDYIRRSVLFTPK